jgi:hypothetical protein
MRIIISESQYRILKESKNKKAILVLIEEMGLHGASEFLGIPVYELIEMGFVKSYDGDLDLRDTPIESLGSLEEVGGYLDLRKTPIKSLGKLRKVGDSLNLGKSEIEDLGELNFVGESLALYGTPIKSLGNLVYVGYDLFIMDTPKLHMSDEEIRSQVEIKKRIYKK